MCFKVLIQNQINMYSCGVDTCKKTVDVSNTVNSKVALSRLKNHFAKMHRDMDCSSFSYETRYNKDVVNAVKVSVEMPTADEPREVVQP